LAELDLDPSPISTQIVEAEFLVDYVHALLSAFGVLANIADDMRHLQRSEIGEVEEFFGKEQVGSSTMPHKKNPIMFETIKSLWKTFMPRIVTVYSDQISEHQRDLTNLESSRFISEIVVSFFIAVELTNQGIKGLAVQRNRMEENLRMGEGWATAEPAHLLLSSRGHKKAHEEVRRLTMKSRRLGKDFRDLLLNDRELRRYFKGLSPKQKEVLKDPRKYIGISSKKAQQVCAYWEKEMKRLDESLKREKIERGS
jgi:adenylosuccinate lyase